MTARYIANMSAERWAEAVTEHEAILQCLSDRDGKKLADVLKRHLAKKLETVKDWLRSQSTQRP